MQEKFEKIIIDCISRKVDAIHQDEKSGALACSGGDIREEYSLGAIGIYVIQSQYTGERFWQFIDIENIDENSEYYQGSIEGIQCF